eukprot:4893438-Amphidinium_carterae.2
MWTLVEWSGRPQRVLDLNGSDVLGYKGCHRNPSLRFYVVPGRLPHLLKNITCQVSHRDSMPKHLEENV